MSLFTDPLSIICGDALSELRKIDSESVQCCVTSPPYWGLRDYGTAKWNGGDADCDHSYNVSSPYNANFNERWGNSPGQKKQESERHQVAYKGVCAKCGANRIDSQLGLEKTPEEYVAKMVEIFREVRRVLRDDGTLWLNLGDTYAGGGNNSGNTQEITAKQESNRGNRYVAKPVPNGLKPKDLCGIPWRVAFALQAYGWWLRSDIIWHKPNPMPESVTDRPTKSHEYIFLLSKKKDYFYDYEAILEPVAYDGRMDTTVKPSANYAGLNLIHGQQPQQLGRGLEQERWPNKIAYVQKGDSYGINGQAFNQMHAKDGVPARNKRTVWTVNTQTYPEAHFATYPPDLIKPCVLAGSCVGDTVLDPFAGSGTTGMVALELGRKAILIELNPDYIELIRQRCDVTIGMAL